MDLENDIDAFRATLKQGDIFEMQSFIDINPVSLFNAEIEWIDPKSQKGKWLMTTYKNLTRGSYAPTVLNMFSVSRRKLDKDFEDMVDQIAQKRKRKSHKNIADN